MERTLTKFQQALLDHEGTIRGILQEIAACVFVPVEDDPADCNCEDGDGRPYCPCFSCTDCGAEFDAINAEGKCLFCFESGHDFNFLVNAFGDEAKEILAHA